MINGVVIRQPDAHTDHRGDLWTLWKDNDFDLDFNHDKVSTSENMFCVVYMATINLGS